MVGVINLQDHVCSWAEKIHPSLPPLDYLWLKPEGSKQPTVLQHSCYPLLIHPWHSFAKIYQLLLICAQWAHQVCCRLY
jgi:hypothetical protein